MTNNKRKMMDDEPKLSSNGQCITLHTTRPKVWYDVLVLFYYDGVPEDHPTTDVNWDDDYNNQKEISVTEIKYVNRAVEPEMSFTLKLWHGRGTITVQGPSHSVTNWLQNHYPTLQKSTAKLIHTTTVSSLHNDATPTTSITTNCTTATTTTNTTITSSLVVTTTTCTTSVVPAICSSASMVSANSKGSDLTNGIEDVSTTDVATTASGNTSTSSSPTTGGTTNNTTIAPKPVYVR